MPTIPTLTTKMSSPPKASDAPSRTESRACAFERG
jgi:hypothetical protein